MIAHVPRGRLCVIRVNAADQEDVKRTSKWTPKLARAPADGDNDAAPPKDAAGDLEAANGQLRSFLEDLYVELARRQANYEGNEPVAALPEDAAAWRAAGWSVQPFAWVMDAQPGTRRAPRAVKRWRS